MKYKGFEIVLQMRAYEIWSLDAAGNPYLEIESFDPEDDAYLVYDVDSTGDATEQSDKFPEGFDSVAEAKAAIDKYRPVYKQEVEVK